MHLKSFLIKGAQALLVSSCLASPSFSAERSASLLRGHISTLKSDLQALRGLIIEATQARENPLPDLVTSLTKEAACLPAPAQESFQGLLFSSDQSYIRPPEDLLDNLPRHKTDFLVKPYLDISHPFLHPLANLQKKITNFTNQLDATVSPGFLTMLQALQAYYQDYVNILCAASPSERDKLLSPVHLSIESLGISQSYLIHKDVAYKILSCDEFDLIKKANATGSSPVAAFGGIHFKRNLRDIVYQEISHQAYKLVKVNEQTSGSSSARTFEKKYFEGSPADKRTLKDMVFQEISHQDYKLGKKSKQTSGSSSTRTFKKEYFERILADKKTLNPGMEWAMYAFSTLLTGEGVCPSALVTLTRVPQQIPKKETQAWQLYEQLNARSTSELEKTTLVNGLLQDAQLQDQFGNTYESYTVQASRTVVGNNLGIYLKQPQGLSTLDRQSYSNALMASLLVNPADAKEDNFMVDPNHKLVSIDNDLVLAADVVHGVNSQGISRPDIHYCEVKNVLYCLKDLLEEPVHPAIRCHILQHSPGLFLLKWLALLQDQNKFYQALFLQKALSNKSYSAADLPVQLPVETSAALLDKSHSAVNLPIQLSTRTIAALLDRFTLLQQTLKQHPKASHAFLLKTLHPVVASYYQAVGDRFNNPLKAFECIYTNGVSIEELPDAANFKETLHQDSQEEKTYKVRNLQVIDCVKSLLDLWEDQTSTGLSQTLDIILTEFKSHARPLLPDLPNNIWHLAVQGQATKKVFNYLFKRDPQGINRLDEQGKTPLDHAFESLLTVEKNKISPKKGKPTLSFKQVTDIAYLINKHASCLSFTSQVYQALKRHPSLPSGFWQTLEKLERRMDKVRQVVTWEELFPLVVDQRPLGIIQGASGDKRWLTPDIQKQLDDPNHRVPHGRREVTFVEKGRWKAFIKFYPEIVGLEEAIGDLTRRIIGFGAPYGELFRFPDGQPAWVSQAISGDNLQKVLLDSPKRLNQLEPVSLHQMILMAMLVNPEDGKPDNYIVEPHPDKPNSWRLSCPDNDHGFVPAFVKTTPKKGSLLAKPKLVVQVKTILYCLDAMQQPIPQQAQQSFLQQDPLTLMQEWLSYLQGRNQDYRSLFPNDQEVDKLLKEKECLMGVPFQTGMVGHLYSKWLRLQDYLSQSPELTPLELLSKLEPRLANRYREAFTQKRTAQDRFVWVDGPFYHQNKGIHFTTLTPSAKILLSQDIPIQQSDLKAIRDGTGRSPVQAVAELAELVSHKAHQGLVFTHMGSDYQRETFLKDFDFTAKSPSQQRQVLDQAAQYAAGLRNLVLAGCAVLDNKKLEKSFLLGQLVYLDLHSCQSITEDILPLLANDHPGLERLNLSGLPSLRCFAKRANLNYKEITFKQLQQLYLNHCPALTTVHLGAPCLKVLWINQAKQLKELQLRVPALEALYGQGVPITDKMLYTILIQAPGIILVDIDTALVTEPAERILEIFTHRSTQANLDSVGIEQQGLIILAHNTNLTSLDLSNNQIEDTAVQTLAVNTTLTELILGGNRIRDIGAQVLAANTTLRALDLCDNQIGDIGAQALAINTTLTELNLWYNQIGDTGAKALAANTTLVKLKLWHNQIGDTGAQALAANTTLKALDLGHNEFGSTGVQALDANTTLKELNFTESKIIM